MTTHKIRKASIQLTREQIDFLNKLIDKAHAANFEEGEVFSVSRPAAFSEFGTNNSPHLSEIALVPIDKYKTLLQYAHLLEQCLANPEKFDLLVQHMRDKGDLPTPGKTTIQ